MADCIVPSSRAPGPGPLHQTPQAQCQQAMEQSRSTPGLPAHTLFVKCPLDPLLGSTDPYISDDYMHKYRIKWRLFDISSGASFDPTTRKVDPTCKPFTCPFSSEDMADALELHKPWISPTYGTYEPISWDDDLDNWWHGYRIGDHLDMYLRSHHTGEVPGLIYSTDWQSMDAPSWYNLNHQNKVVKWSVTHLWQRESAEPHVGCVLADRVPLNEARISVPEMRTILTLSGARAMEEDHHHRKVIPVTVISTSGKKLRVVVGVVDSMNKSVEVRTGRIIDLAEGVEDVKENWSLWKTVLCWIVGQPIGATA